MARTDVVQVTATTDLLTTVTKPAYKKRTVTSSSISFPAYATPCSGFYRFSSACSCIGVTPRIHTASAPSTTITLPITETSLTEITEVVDTASVTITDATVSITTTDTTVTNTIATTVEVVISDASYAFYTTNADEAIALRLDSNGRLWAGDRVAKGNPANSGGSALQFVFGYPDAFTDSREPFVCTKYAESFISCAVGPQKPPVTLAFTLRTSSYISSSCASAAVSTYTIIKSKLQ
ncbi:hypothetical protein TWF788_009103 [Orbilia oligospora]|uniref:Uncharacterized protein n=1 Tax=Orbilia oligospora TaxID=2813651 RepID=A0A6G1MAU7_ORBOL|nr:hypothetical protein TWF788_009103 [Orbilia oligospora]KAF3251049.1 hypothetical protein TWF192_005027 [Orbilia oligospora]